MPKIQLLSDSVASRIAAGEVIERPSSLLKELVENSLDAGAANISVEVYGAGKKSLRISDDGCGMDAEDCASCVERHATSKISSLEDLSKLDTFGFRGEALYAIAAVSRLSIRSAVRGAKSGWGVDVNAGKIVSSAPAPAIRGTTIEVKDLFFNTPARLKFLKSDAFEKSALTSVMEEAALANPGVHFTYKSEGRTTLHFPPAAGKALESYEHRLKAVLGKDLSAGLIPVVMERPEMHLRAFISPAETLNPSRGLQYWFINRRPIGSRVLQQALYRAYHDFRSKDRHPICVAHIEMPADSFDVNVHPGKREVRFKSDRDMYELITGLAGAALSKSKLAHALTPEARADIIRERAPVYHSSPSRSFSQEPLLKLESSPSQSFQAEAGSPRWFTPPYRYLGQIERSYLLFEASGGLFILDQHAAAERILFEKYQTEIEKGNPKTQRLMLPLPIELPASRLSAVLAQSARLARLGFEIKPFGKTTLHVLAAPALFHKAADLREIIHRLLDSLDGPVRAAQDTQHDAIATIACKAAVKAHDALGEREALQLLENLKDCKDGTCCPHGRRAILSLNREELARRFQRPGAPPL